MGEEARHAGRSCRIARPRPPRWWRSRRRSRSPAGADEGPAGTPYLCITCGTQFAESAAPGTLPDLRGRAAVRQPRRPEVDDAGGPPGLAQERHQAGGAGLYSINTEPKFGIGQRAFLIQTGKGNILWDCVGLVDDATIAQVKELGGIAEIAISHPHYYTAMVEWSRAFGDAPIHLHEAERQWVMRPDPCIRFWKGRTLELRDGLTLVSTGGHFEGYQVLHWPAGAGGRGA